MTDSVAIVTGSSSGIGRATALRLARDFSAVVLVARSDEKLAEVSGLIHKMGKETLVIETDLGAPASAEMVIRETLKRFERIDALINIAGAGAGLVVFQMTDDEWEGGMALKFHGARRLAIHAWPALKNSKGSIVFISGNAADIPKAV